MAQTEFMNKISRINTAKENIQDALEAKGLVVSDNIEDYATAIGQITGGMKEYTTESDMNNDIANISTGEVVKVTTGPKFFIKEIIESTPTMTELVSASETITPEEYQENTELVDDILGDMPQTVEITQNKEMDIFIQNIKEIIDSNTTAAQKAMTIAPITNNTMSIIIGKNDNGNAIGISFYDSNGIKAHLCYIETVESGTLFVHALSELPNSGISLNANSTVSDLINALDSIYVNRYELVFEDSDLLPFTITDLSHIYIPTSSGTDIELEASNYYAVPTQGFEGMENNLYVNFRAIGNAMTKYFNVTPENDPLVYVPEVGNTGIVMVFGRNGRINDEDQYEWGYGFCSSGWTEISLNVNASSIDMSVEVISGETATKGNWEYLWLDGTMPESLANTSLYDAYTENNNTLPLSYFINYLRGCGNSIQVTGGGSDTGLLVDLQVCKIYLLENGVPVLHTFMLDRNYADIEEDLI